MSDICSPSVYVACKGLSDLGNGPNKPTATIIGCEYSASLQGGALILSLVRARNSGSDKNLVPHLWQHIIDVCQVKQSGLWIRIGFLFSLNLRANNTEKFKVK